MANDVVEESTTEAELEQDQYLVFGVKSQEFAFQAIRIQEITAVLETTEVPNAPRYVEGIANLKGRLATIINFRKKFGFEPKEQDEDTRTIIVEQEGYPIGILVDSVEEVIKIPEKMVQRVPESTSKVVSEEYITGIALLDDRLITLLDVGKVLTTTELIDTDVIAQLAQEARKTPAEVEANEIDSSRATEAAKER